MRSQTIAGPAAAYFASHRKVFVLGDDRSRHPQRVLPDRPVGCLAESDILDVDGVMPDFPQPSGQCRRQLGVYQELHLASERTA